MQEPTLGVHSTEFCLVEASIQRQLTVFSIVEFQLTDILVKMYSKREITDSHILSLLPP